MKQYSLIIIFWAIFIFYACDDVKFGPKEPEGPWNTGPIEGYSVTPINGGAKINYTMPNDPDILYIMAEYERNGKIFTEKSSVHKSSLTIEGFHRTPKVKAKLFKVNKYEQRSAPIEVEFEPMESLIDIAFKSLNLIPGFGGVIASWENPKATELGIRMMKNDPESNNKLKTWEMYFSTLEKEKHSFRGHDAVQSTFAFVFEDKWGNISDTTSLTTTPFFETLIPKPYVDYRANIPYDNITNLSGRTTATLWDNIVNTASHGWLTNPGGSGISMTIDMKQRVKLSRIIHHPYHLNSVYGQANITEMEIWGTDNIDFSKLQDRPYWLDSLSTAEGRNTGIDPTTVLPERTFKDDWQYLGYHAVPIYTLATDIQALSQNGSEYEMPIEAEPVRYIRIFVRAIARTKPPGLNNYWSMSEITFYGDNTVPQE